MDFGSQDQARGTFDDAFASIKVKYEDARLKEKNHTETIYKILVGNNTCKNYWLKVVVLVFKNSACRSNYVSLDGMISPPRWIDLLNDKLIY